MMERADPPQKLYNRLRLWEFPDQYVLEPSDGSSAPFLAISRRDGSINRTDDVAELVKLHVPKIWGIFGVVGSLKLRSGTCLLVITERECVGSYLGYPVFKIISMKVFPCDHCIENATEEQEMEKYFSQLVSVAERTPGLYFSYDVNITYSVQRMHDLGDESKLLPLWRQADPQFLWNSYMLEMLIDNKLDPYLLPIMQGSFQSFKYPIGKDILEVTLVARRSTRRIGTRMWKRGADSDGYVANFVETEQIIQVNGYTASFIQVRGSIPLLWNQIVDLTYKPKFEIMELEEVPRVVERHFLDLRKRYGNVLIVNLVNKHGGEGRLCEKFGSAMQQVGSDEVRYTHFDFHRICGDSHIEWLSILYHRVFDFIFNNRYFLSNEKGEKVEGQIGVVRTNCIDCLDRTNVTQSLIARKMLESQLRRIGVFSASDAIIRHPNLDKSFKNLWANHGDAISIQYTSTPALKGDFVRLGQRTLQGILKDGWNSLLRYYLNTFCDGTRQDAIDLIQGHYSVSVSQSTTYRTRNDGTDSITSLPLACLLIMAGLMLAKISLTRVQHDWWNLLFSIMWTSISLAIVLHVRANGRNFCNRPRLREPQH